MKYPLNDEKIYKICQLLGCRFDDPQLLCRALSHRSYAREHNERLEFLGDSVLNMIIAEELYRLHPQACEGELSRLRAYLVRGEMLALVAKDITLGQFLLLGQGEQKSGGCHRESILADCFEALTAAVFLDQGYATCQRVILHCYGTRLTEPGLMEDLKDPKTRLQEFVQSNSMPLPQYTLVETHGKEHQQLFEIRCHIPGVTITTQGRGYTRRKAEKDAAEHMLAKLQTSTRQ